DVVGRGGDARLALLALAHLRPSVRVARGRRREPEPGIRERPAEPLLPRLHADVESLLNADALPRATEVRRDGPVVGLAQDDDRRAGVHEAVVAVLDVVREVLAI